MEPFLGYSAFAEQFRQPLGNGQQAIAERLLEVVSDWIHHKKPDVNSRAAEQVVFEVVRDALLYGDLEKLSSFQNVTSKRTEAGTFSEARKIIAAYLTRDHMRLLGIAFTAAPRGSFTRGDY